MEEPKSAEMEYTEEFTATSPSQQAFARISNRTLMLYFEIPVLFIASIIGIGALINRRRSSTNPLRQSQY